MGTGFINTQVEIKEKVPLLPTDYIKSNHNHNHEHHYVRHLMVAMF